nr:MAG TPA: hypothetical protein [Caudoviricetes sp.]
MTQRIILDFICPRRLLRGRPACSLFRLGTLCILKVHCQV